MTETDQRAKVREYLDFTLGEAYLPELGRMKKGKVRDIYSTSGSLVMVTNDRISAFDYVIPRLVPFKGMILNEISKWAMQATADLVPNALVDNTPHCPPLSHLCIQKEVKPLPVECIVRGYIWGSMAGLVEKGAQEICGLPVAPGAHRYQKLDTPLFTPTTKADMGAHDENINFDQMTQLVGSSTLANQLKEVSLKLYQRGVQLFGERGFLLIDTKYEFGLDAQGNLVLIDEVNTPDSSRLVRTEEYTQKYPQIRAGEKVTIKEFSKQYVRDVLLSKPEFLEFQKLKAPTRQQAAQALTLTDDELVETTMRYIEIYETLLNKPFKFPSMVVSPRVMVLSELKMRGLAKGCCVVLMAGSDSDMDWLTKIGTQLDDYGIPNHKRICSAHKQPGTLEKVIEEYNQSAEPLVLVGCAGGVDALSGTASFLSVHPLVSCPPDGRDNGTPLENPPGSSNACIYSICNLVKFVAQVFSLEHPQIAQALLKKRADKIESLVAADTHF